MNLNTLIHDLYHEPDFNKRRYIPDKLAKLGDWGSTEYLGQVMNNENERIELRIECAESLGKQGDPKAINFLKKSIKSSEMELRRTSLWSLGQIGSDSTIDLVMTLVEDKEFMIQKWVVKSLGRIQSIRCLKMLEFIIQQYYIKYKPHLHLIITAVLDQLRYANDEIISIWQDRVYDYCQNQDSTLVKQAALKLMLAISERGIVPNKDYFRNLLQNLNQSQNHLKSLIIQILGFANDTEKLEDLTLTKDVVIALSLTSSSHKLSEILDNHSQYSPEIVATVLENITFKYDYNPFLDSVHPDIQYAALNYAVRIDSRIDLLDKFIVLGKRINYVLGLTKYTLSVSISTIENKGLAGSKVERQTIIQILKDSDYDKHKKVLPSVLNLLQEISERDRIWHIRRDARQLISVLQTINSSTKL